MKFSSGIKAVAGAVAASLLLVTAHPAQADPVTTPYTRDINTIAEQTRAAATPLLLQHQQWACTAHQKP